MAHLIPESLPTVKHQGGRFRERDTIERLQLSLSDEYEIYHSIPLHSIQPQGTTAHSQALANTDADRFGEIDIVILDPTGKILIMEVKAGAVTLRNGQLFKAYTTKEHDIARQCAMQHAAMINRLNEANLHTHVTTCLVIPDYSLQQGSAISFPRERIIDATQYDQLGTWVRTIFTAGKGCTSLPALRQLLRNEFNVTTNLAVMREQIQGTIRQLSDGLATWVPRISSPSGNYQIQATAGSGKTQLALKLLENAVIQKHRTAYFCYNRALADHLRTLAPSRATISNFHELCVEHYQRLHGKPDFTEAGIFDRIAAIYTAHCATHYTDTNNDSQAHYDVLIIDEAQDFEPEWLQSLFSQLTPDGQLYLMEDEDQRLYERAAGDLTDAVNITCRDNYRSPRLICDFINGLGLTTTPIHSKNPYRGTLPGIHSYATDRELMTKTAHAVAELQAQGFALTDIVVLSGRGRATSALLSAEKIGPHTTKRFTGDYSRDGDPVWSQGELLVESIYRYKGQSSPAVVLSEISFKELTSKERRKLFVGITRAQMAIEIVLTAQADTLLSARLGSDTM